MAAFQAELATILARVAVCLKMRLFKEQIIVCLNNRLAITTPGASVTRSLPLGDCIEKLTAPSENNQVSTVWTFGQSGITQNETVDGLARQGTGTKPTGSKPYLLLSPSSYKFEIKNGIKRCRQMQQKICEKYRTSQICLEGPTDRYFQYINKLDGKHCRMLVGLLMRPAKLLYRTRQPEIHAAQDGGVKSPSSRKCDAEKKCRYTYSVSAQDRKVRSKTIGRARIEPDQIKEVKLRSIAVVSKGAVMLSGQLQ